MKQDVRWWTNCGFQIALWGLSFGMLADISTHSVQISLKKDSRNGESAIFHAKTSQQ